MATSGSVDFSQTRNEVILDAFQILGVYGIGRTVSAEDLTFASNMLNKMVKAWEAKGLHLFTKEEGVLYIVPGQAKYTLGPDSTDAYATKLEDQVITKLSAAAASGATSLTVADTTGMTVGDNIGVVTQDKTIHWTTIATIPDSTSLTITVGLDDDANNGALVYTFTNRVNKPLRVLDCRRRTGLAGDNNQFDLPLTEIAYQDYFELPVKTTSSIPNQFHYNPKNLRGDLYLWPGPSDGSERIMFTYERKIQDLDSTSDDFDFPSEWLEALTYQLAVRLARPFGKASAIQDILPLASQMLEDLLNWDAEVSEISLVADMRWEE